MGYIVSMDDDDELDELFELGIDSQPISELIDMDSLSEEQKQLLLTGKTAPENFDKEFHALFKQRDSLMKQVFQMELDEEDDDIEDE